MASSRKRKARSAPVRKPLFPKPAEHDKPSNGKPQPRRGKYAEAVKSQLAQGVTILDDCHAILTHVMPHLGGDVKKNADRLRIDISLHLRQIADFLGDTAEGLDLFGEGERTEGGAA